MTELKPTVHVRLVAEDAPLRQESMFPTIEAETRCNHLETGRELQESLFGGTDEVCSGCGERIES